MVTLRDYLRVYVFWNCCTNGPVGWEDERQRSQSGALQMPSKCDR